MCREDANAFGKRLLVRAFVVLCAATVVGDAAAEPAVVAPPVAGKTAQPPSASAANTEPRPPSDPYASRRERMVREDIAADGVFGRDPVRDDAVLEAMRTVPRHLFVPGEQIPAAYEDRPLPIGHGQTISQPYIVAAMTELLGLGEESKVLEVGTGSGYQAAVLAEIVESVYSIEIVREVAAQGRRNLDAAGYQKVRTREGDGYFGWQDAAPFDGIIVTAAASHIPPPLVEQLKPGGRMVIPVGPPFQVQQLMVVEKRTDGSIRQRGVMPVRFVPLTRGAQER